MGSGKRQNQIAHRRHLFEQKFERGSETECWEWQAAKNSRGIGIVSLGDLAPNSVSAMAASWFFYRDTSFKFGSGVKCVHLCLNNLCVNPAHLALIERGGDLPRHEAVLQYLALRYPSASVHLMAAIKEIQRDR